MSKIILSMKGITKSFPGVLALNKVDLELKEGEVLGLVGENGAGKSTILKILSGALTKDEGEIIFEGNKLESETPYEAIKLGISIIYQELDYFGPLTVAENIMVNDFPRKGKNIKGIVDWAETYSQADKAIRRVTNDIDVKSVMSSLTTAKKQLVEIAKAMRQKMRILILDEPTSVLNRIETEQLLKLVREIADTGVGVIYISHRLQEIFAISDRVQVMRDGKSVATFETGKTNNEELVGCMVGRTLAEMYPHLQLERGEAILELKNLSAGKVKNVNFTLYNGEILGLFGLMGAGRTELARAIFGDLTIHKGSIFIKGKKVKCNSPADAIKNGIAYTPSDRKSEGLMLINSVKFNITITIINKLMRLLKINSKKEKEIAQKWIKALNIRTPGIETKIESLSGGNQQKVIISKWLETNPKILILNDPTRGIDVGAKAEIYTLMEQLCAKGIGIIMISSELQETLAMSDRILVMSEGKITGELSRKDASQEKLMKLAIGSI